MKKGWIKKSMALLLAATMACGMAGCGKGSGTKDKAEVSKERKNMVYAGEDFTIEGIEGDVSTFLVKGDALYLTTSEWIEGSGEANAETAAEEESEMEVIEDDASEETGTEEVTEEDSSEEEGVEFPETDESEMIPKDEDTEEDSQEETTEEPEDTDSSEENTEDIQTEEEMVVDGTSITRLYKAKIDGTGATEIPLPSFTPNQWINYMCVDEEGIILLMVGEWKEKTQTTEYVAYRISDTGEELGTVSLAKELDITEDSYVNAVLMDNEGNIIVGKDQEIILLNKDFKKQGSIKTENWIEGLAVTKDGTVIFGSSGENGAQVQSVDVKNSKVGETYKLELNYFSGSDSLMNGSGDYDFYYRDDSGIFGYNMAESKSTKLLDYVASNLTSNSTYGIKVIDSDTMLGTSYTDDGKTVFTKYTKVDPSQVKEKEIITMGAMYIDDNMKNAAIAFNKSNDKYQIDIKDYSNEEEPDTKFNADIVAGNIPDIICMNNLPVEQYIAKGILEDLTPYFEKDEELSTEDIIPSLYEAMQVDGKLYYVASSFSISTLIGKTADVGTESGWTFADMKALMESKGEGVSPFNTYSMYKTYMLSTLLGQSLNDYIDWKTGKCSFDGEGFKSMLEFCNTYGTDKEPDYDEEGPSFPSLVKDGKVLFVDGYISTDEIQLYQAMYDDDITFIGYPSEDKKGSYFGLSNQIAISSKSNVKDGAWEFIRTFMTEKYQSTGNNIWDIPTRQDSLELFIEIHSATEKFTDKFGEEHEPYSSGWGYDDLEVEIKPANEQQQKMFRDLINNTTKISNYNYKQLEMIQEEAEPYFKGEKSLDEVTKIIQNRMSTYVNENR